MKNLGTSFLDISAFTDHFRGKILVPKASSVYNKLTSFLCIYNGTILGKTEEIVFLILQWVHGSPKDLAKTDPLNQ